MKYRLDEAHYDEFVELPAGTEVGDGTEVSWKYPVTCANVALRGKYKPPSRSMTPLDDEARKAFAEYFKEESPERDPTKKIPIHGTDPNAGGTMAPPTGTAFTGKPIPPAPPGRPNPAPSNPTEKTKTGIDATKDDSLAKEDPALNKTPEGHKPSESIPAGKK